MYSKYSFLLVMVFAGLFIVAGCEETSSGSVSPNNNDTSVTGDRDSSSEGDTDTDSNSNYDSYSGNDSDSDTSVVIHPVGALSRDSLARPTFSII